MRRVGELGLLDMSPRPDLPGLTWAQLMSELVSCPECDLQARVAGVREEAARHPGIEIVDAYYHKETPQDAAAKVEQVQGANPEIAGWAMVGGWPLFTDHAIQLAPGRG